MGRQRHRDLALVRHSGGSPRFFDVALRAQAAALTGAPLFETAHLNRVILIKHTLREREREELFTERRTATKIVFPIDLADLSIGGYSLFIEEVGFNRKLAAYLGDARGVEALPRDLARLRLFADAPMFDPYVLRERFRMQGFSADDHWFAIDLERERQVIAFIFNHIRQMFLGATGDAKLAEKFAEGFCFKVFSTEFSEYAARMNEFFGLESGHMVQALFAWKALLYQRLVFEELQDRLAGELKLLLDARLPGQFSQADIDYMQSVQDRLRATVRARYGAARMALARYNTAYIDFSERRRPGSFIQFLRDSPDLCFTLGENIALLLHYGGLLTFRIRHERALRSSGQAIELHQDLAVSLDRDEDNRDERLNLAAV